jgi:hypothetical protein
MSGTLDGKFSRKTGTADWAEARRIAEVYEQAESWTGQPRPKPLLFAGRAVFGVPGTAPAAVDRAATIV